MSSGPSTSQGEPIEEKGEGKKEEKKRTGLPSTDDFLLNLVKHCAAHIDNHKDNNIEIEGTCEKLLHYIRNALPFLINTLQNKNQSSQST